MCIAFAFFFFTFCLCCVIFLVFRFAPQNAVYIHLHNIFANNLPRCEKTNGVNHLNCKSINYIT